MKELFLRSLSPAHQFVILLLLCLISFLLFALLGYSLVEQLYGLDFRSDPTLVTQLDLPYVAAAHKILILCQHLGVFVLPALVFNQMFTFRQTGSFLFWGERPQWVKVMLVILTTLCALPFINFLVVVNESIRHIPGLETVNKSIHELHESTNQVQNSLLNTDGAGFVINVLLIAVLPAIGEEFFFRGVLQKLFARWTGKVHAAVWISAILFSALHFQFYWFFPRLLLGVLFGYIMLWTGSIWYAVLAHFVNNFVTLIVDRLVRHGRLSPDVNSFGAHSEDWLIMAGITVLLGLLTLVLWRRSVFPLYQEAYTIHPHVEFIPPRDPDEDEYDT